MHMGRRLATHIRRPAQGVFQENRYVDMAKNGGYLAGAALTASTSRPDVRTTRQHTGSEQNTFQVQVVAQKRLQAETAQELDALLPAILDRASSIQRRALTLIEI